MAVSITHAMVSDVVDAVRANDTSEERKILTRLLAVATSRVEWYAPGAPVQTQNEAVIRFVGYLYDQPNSSSARHDYSSAFANCGASSLLLPWRIHNALNVGGSGRT